MKNKKFALILSQFPEIHETFILRELVEMKQKNIDFLLFSLKKCKDKFVHPEAEILMQETHYSPFIFSWRIISAFVYFLLKTPIKLVSTVIYIIKHNYKSVELLIKSLGVLPQALLFAKIMKANNIDHIHSHWATIPTTSAVIISRLLSIPYSFTAHAWDIFLNQTMLLEKLKNASFVITCTGYNKKYLDSLQKNQKNMQSEVIKNYHGIDFENLPKIDKHVQKNFIFSIGRLCEQKGFPYLIKACKILKDAGIEIQCKIVGEGPDREKLNDLIERENLHDTVSLLGLKTHEKIFELFNQAEIFVLPCVIAKNGDRDGIPNVLIEALAMKTPVVSTTVSGVPELIIKNKTGLTVNPRNSEELSVAINKLLYDKNLQDKFAQNGRELVEKNFDIKKNVAKLSDIFFSSQYE